jgi:hypothetical protein
MGILYADFLKIKKETEEKQRRAEQSCNRKTIEN